MVVHLFFYSFLLNSALGVTIVKKFTCNLNNDLFILECFPVFKIKTMIFLTKIFYPLIDVMSEAY